MPSHQSLKMAKVQNETYVLHDVLWSGREVSGASDVDDSVRIESEICRPFLAGEDIIRYEDVTSNKAVIVPYQQKEDRWELIPEEILRRNYPLTYSYLKKHKTRLEQRENGRMKGPNWYGYIYPKNLEIISAVKILTRVIVESVAFTGDLIGDTAFSTGYGITLKPRINLKLYYLLALLNSNFLDFVFRQVNSLLRGGYIQVFTQYLEPLPIRRIHFTTPEAERERLTAELIVLYEQDVTGTSEVPVTWDPLLARVEALLPKDENGEFLAFKEGASGSEEKSDVVHDLLTHLAEEMIDLNKAKQAQVDSFWDDLESVTAPADFDELRNRGKWEQSLAKDAACVPYVDAESRSTKHIDESLGWDEACFHAFAGMLIGKSSLTPKITAVYRQHHAPYKELVARIDATDDLIDQVVYRLYGLTEEEIGVVGG